MKQTIIDIRKFCKENKIKEKDVCKEVNISRHTLFSWRKEAPKSVVGVFKASKEVKEVDILKVLKGWQEPTFALSFIRDFMTKYNCKFEDIVFEK